MLKLLNNRFELERFFSGESEIKQILNEKGSSSNFGFPRTVCVLAKTPFVLLTYVVLKILAGLCSLFRIRRGHIGCSILAKHALRETKQLIDRFFLGPGLLASAMNCHRMENYDFYLQSPLPFDAIKSPEVKPLLYDCVQEKIEFDNLSGNCRGAVDWFLYLFNKTKGHFPDLKTHLQAVAKQFVRGVPRQAALLQSFKSFNATLINFLHIKRDIVLECTGNSPLENFSYKVKDLEPGEYSLYAAKHLMAYFKQDENTAFLFDPSDGLIDLTGKDQALLLKEHLSQLGQPIDAIYVAQECPVSEQLIGSVI